MFDANVQDPKLFIAALRAMRYYFSFVTPLNGLGSDLRSRNWPVALSRLVQSSVFGL